MTSHITARTSISPNMSPANPPSLPLTLIVAMTPRMGIGYRGALPWPLLKSEMAYFARVTRRASPGAVNAVIMGRRTWESIPAKFRPLKGRLNVVLTRQPERLGLECPEYNGPAKSFPGPVAASSIMDALEKLQRITQSGTELTISRGFVIGGAEIYGAALQTASVQRVLLTRLRNEFECDTYFPLQLNADSQKVEVERQPGVTDTWVKCSKLQLDAWTGEEVPPGVRTEGEIEWEYEMWEKQDKTSG